MSGVSCLHDTPCHLEGGLANLVAMLPRAVALLLVGVVGGAVLTGSPSAPARVVWYRPRTVVVLADRADSGGADGGDDGGVVCRSWAGRRPGHVVPTVRMLTAAGGC